MDYDPERDPILILVSADDLFQPMDHDLIQPMDQIRIRSHEVDCAHVDVDHENFENILFSIFLTQKSMMALLLYNIFRLHRN